MGSATSTSCDRRLVNRLVNLLEPILPDDVRLVLWDGTCIKSPAARTIKCSIISPTPEGVRAFLTSWSSSHLAEAYISGLLDIDGRIGAVVKMAEAARVHFGRPLTQLRKALLVRDLPRRSFKGQASPRRFRARLPFHAAQRRSASIAFHYDKPVGFWRLWLDPLLQYTCAYYLSDDESLERAQLNKLDLVFNKLDLQPDDHLLDIGFGWGGLLSFASETRGVRSTGITLSRMQLDCATQLLAPYISRSRCKLQFGDFCKMDGDELVDKATGIGILEHLGPAGAASYFRSTFRRLRPGGLFLTQAIAWLEISGGSRTNPFIDNYIFPDGRLMTIGETIAHAESAGFEVVDIKGLRSHYVRTTTHWLERLEAERDAVTAIVGNPVYRAFRLYLAGSQHRFESGRIGVFQTLLRKPGTQFRSASSIRLQWDGATPQHNCPAS